MNLMRLASEVTHEKALKERGEKMEIALRALIASKEGREAGKLVVAEVAGNLGDAVGAGLDF